MGYTLSRAQREDLPEIVAIYNSTVASRQATADLQPVSVAEREAWFAAHQCEHRPLYVVQDAVSGCLMAWASLSDYYPRAAYHRTAEVSIYIHAQHRGAGLGKWLLGEMIRRAPALGVHKLVAVIFAHNAASIALFRGSGFEIWGRLPEVCDLDGMLADVVLLGKTV